MAITERDKQFSNYFRISKQIQIQMQTQLFFAELRAGGIADKNVLGHNFEFIEDTDTKDMNFELFSAMHLDKR